MIDKTKQYRYRDYPKETVTILDTKYPGPKPVVSRSSFGAVFYHDADGRYVTPGPLSGRRDLIEIVEHPTIYSLFVDGELFAAGADRDTLVRTAVFSGLTVYDIIEYRAVQQ